MVKSREIDTMIEAAQLGGKIVKSYFGKSIEKTQKTISSDLQTVADIQSEKAILEVISSKFPKVNILAEEKGLIDKGSDSTFIIDPLDGTHNFALGIPNFTVSIGFEKNGKIIAGVIYQPITNEVYWAEAGRGSYIGGHKLKCSIETKADRMSVAHGLGYLGNRKRLEQAQTYFFSLNARRYMVNWCPSSDMCLLASGKIEMVIMEGVETHDIAAGKLIAKEAGAILTRLDGSSENDEMSTTFLASANKEILENVLSNNLNL